MKIRFNKTELDRFPNAAVGKRATYHDSAQSGLTLRVTATGAKTFAVQKRVDGKPVRVTLGRYPDMTIDQARKAALNALSDMAGGENPVEEKRQRRAKAKEQATVREVLAEYTADRIKRDKMRQRTADDYEEVLEQVGLPVEGIALIIGVDRLLDMMRTAVNVTGDAVVSSLVAISEGRFDRDLFTAAVNHDDGLVDVEPLQPIDVEPLQPI